MRARHARYVVYTRTRAHDAQRTPFILLLYCVTVSTISTTYLQHAYVVNISQIFHVDFEFEFLLYSISNQQYEQVSLER